MAKTTFPGFPLGLLHFLDELSKKKTLGKIRTAIDKDGTAWKRAKSAKSFREDYELAGDSLRRPPRGYDAEHPQMEDLLRKDHIGLCRLDHDAVLSDAIVPETIATFRAARPYMRFLCSAIGVLF